MLELQGLTKVYPVGDRALDGVSLQIPRGQFLALVGASGAGKSTLIRCVNRLVEPTSGEVSLTAEDGETLRLHDLRGRALRSARRRIGMIFQEFALVDRLTVMENVLSGRLASVGLLPSLLRMFPREFVEQAIALLERVGLSDHLHKRADRLSGGQRQRVGIARALLQADLLLLVDEPTANLDPKTAQTVVALLRELARERGLTVVWNSHDIPLARAFADRIVGLQKGRIVFDGEPATLDDAALTQIYGEMTPAAEKDEAAAEAVVAAS